MISLKREGQGYLVDIVPPTLTDYHEEMRDWCEEMFGEGGWNPKCVWRYGWTSNSNTYCFKHEKDAMMFMLRWA